MAKGYNVLMDKEYDYLRLDPIPTPEIVNEYYQKEFYSEERPQINDSSLEVQKNEENFFNRRYHMMLEKIREHFVSDKISLFDIGCGYSQALIYFNSMGMEVCGLEPSPEGAEYAEKIGIPVENCGIEDIKTIKRGKFDVVLMQNVMEHLREPAQALKDIKDYLLKKDGLLIIDVPNEFNDFQVVANEEYNLKEWWIAPPAHINYFSADSLKGLLQQCGFDVKYMESSFPMELFLLFGDVYVGNSELGKQCHEKRVLFEALMYKHGKGNKLRELYNALANLNLGRQVIAYATPRLK